MKLARILRWGLLVPAGAVLVIYSIAVAINWRDRPPSADALRLQRVLTDRPPVAAADNGFIYVLGFDAARGRDPQEEGERRASWLLAFNQHRASLDADPLAGQASFTALKAPAVVRALDACAPDHHEDCPAAFAAAPPGESWSETDRLQLERYRVLVTRRAWREIVPTDVRAPLPAYAGQIYGQRLQFLALRGADAALVRATLDLDLAFWRRMLASSDTLISKMIAVAGLRNHFYFGNLLMHGAARDEAAAAIPAGWRQPMTRAETSLESAMAGELVFTSGLSRELLYEGAQEPDWLEEFNPNPIRWRALRFVARPFYQPQDDINHLAADYAAAADAFAVSPDLVPDAARALKQRAVADPFPSRLYNLVGDFYRSRGITDLSSYGLRVATVEGWRRAALLTAEMRARGVPPELVPAELDRATLRNPSDGAAFTWDAARGAIVYTGVGEQVWRVQHYVY